MALKKALKRLLRTLGCTTLQANLVSRQYLPDAWGLYTPSFVELSILVGSLAMFVTLFLVFVKIFPSVSIYEVKETMVPPENDPPRTATTIEGAGAWPTTQ